MHAFPEPFSVAWTKVILVGPQRRNKMQLKLMMIIIIITIITIIVIITVYYHGGDRQGGAGQGDDDDHHHHHHHHHHQPSGFVSMIYIYDMATFPNSTNFKLNIALCPNKKQNLGV